MEWWYRARPMGVLSGLYLVVFLVWVPLLAVNSHRAISAGHPLPSRRALFIQVVVMHTLFALLTLYTARVIGIPLFPPFQIRGLALGCAALICLVMLGTIPLRWRSMLPEMKQRLMQTRPRSWADMGAWTVISFSAAFSEEIAYRGALFSLLGYFTGSAWIAAVVSAAAFGAAHALQGWRAGALIFLFALALQGIVYLSGSLYEAMLLHFVYDVAAGVLYMRLCGNEPLPPAAA